VFSTCLFCHANLGANEAIEHFPVGRRLAFDGVKGRLWVVCAACERWNLTPLEERWEAIEECEKAFSETRLRVSTEHVGLAKLREGTTLIRIGDPQRPEMAAWRYGDQFHRRRRKHVALAAGGVAVVAGYIVAGPMMGLLGGASLNLLNMPNLLLQSRTVARVRLNGKVYGLNARLLKDVSVRASRGSDFRIDVPYRDWSALWSSGFRSEFGQPKLSLTGDEALVAARQLLPRINRSGGRASQVADAVQLLEREGRTGSLVDRIGKVSGDDFRWFERSIGFNTGAGGGRLAFVPAPFRLALEMSLHEDDERRALEGELSILEDRWREAEEIAAISDDMFVSPGVTSMLKRLRGDETEG
jgi:hypothetical protein